MYQDERLLRIMEYLKDNERITVNKIMNLYGISRDTARRDLVKLEEQGEIFRTRGGALLASEKNEAENQEGIRHEDSVFISKEKRAIAKVALTFIQPGDSLMFDSSMHVQYLADILSVPSVVITNSMKQARILSSRKNVDLRLLGGRLNINYGSLQGPYLFEDMKRYFVDKIFISADGIDSEGITYTNENEGMITKAMTKRGKQVILLADSTVFGTQELFKCLSFNELDVLVTDQNPRSDFLPLLEKSNVKLVVTNET
ncbi:DeoR/GlpR family DNA-binding transcription regulator [Alkalihalobacillus sp. TS-13]|uniref:DeoR/GlpR family DNA-binding transcription regulator n=1 Tax=Alkalihalobacillus sp. TS-13 TaxID=2842455 RepID=UPI001C87C6C2|nr:DeoR/GlpR family DNA-binding transcription regulator [Alkalihalobacillus sp. TS-13]